MIVQRVPGREKRLERLSSSTTAVRVTIISIVVGKLWGVWCIIEGYTKYSIIRFLSTVHTTCRFFSQPVVFLNWINYRSKRRGTIKNPSKDLRVLYFLEENNRLHQAEKVKIAKIERFLKVETRTHVAWGYLYQNVFYINTLVF